MRSVNKPRGQSVSNVKAVPTKGMVSFANAKNRIEGMANFLGNIAEAQGTLEEEEKKSQPLPAVVKPAIITNTANIKKPVQQVVQRATQ